MTHGSSWVDLAEFANTNGSVVGQIYYNNLQGSVPNLSVQTGSTSFTGTDNNGSLTLYFPTVSGPTFGSVTSAQLQLQLPQNDGTLASFTFEATTVNQYNQVLSKWRQGIANANAAAAASQAQAAARQQHKQRLLDNLNNAIQAVEDQVSAIESPGSIGDDEGTLVEDVGTVQEDLGTVQEDNGTFQEDKGSGTNPCGDIMSAYGDAHTAYADGEVMLSDARSGVGSDLAQQHQAVTAAPAIWAAYWRAQDALPSYRPTNPLPPLKVVLTSGDHVVNGAVGQVNGDVNKANGYVAQAYEIVNRANRQNNCGSLRSIPVISHVTAAWLTSK